MKSRQNKHYTTEEENFLKDNFSNRDLKKSYFENKLNRTWSSIQGHANRIGLSRDYKWTKEDIEYLKEFYPDFTVSIESICAKLNRNRNTIAAMAHKLNIPKRKTPINSNYFNEMNSWEKWYILGFLFTDGCNHTRSKDICIELQEEDLYILKKIKDCLNFKGNLHENKQRIKNGKKVKKTWGLGFRDKQISEKLEELGMVKNKSLILEWPKNIPKEFESAFLLGCFDGDGCVTIFKRNKKTFGCGFNFIGTLSMVENFQRVLIENKIVSLTKLYKHSTNTFQMSYSGQLKSNKIREYLYKNATMYLTRKKEKFDYIFKYVALTKY